MRSRADAALQRRCSVEDRAARPLDRGQRDGGLSTWTPSCRATVSVRSAGAQDGPSERFEGFASVTGQPYEMYDMFGPYDEVVSVGAFGPTLARADLDVPLVLDHVSSRRVARTGNAASPLELEEVTSGPTTGLRVLAPSMPMSDPDVAYIVPKLRSDLIDEMSFRFMIVDGRWSEDFMTYTIREVDLHRGDVSIVGYGANPATQGSGLRELGGGAILDPLSRARLELSRMDDELHRDIWSRDLGSAF